MAAPSPDLPAINAIDPGNSTGVSGALRPSQRGVRWQTAIVLVGGAALISLLSGMAATSVLVTLGLLQ
jgi:hypothetical protein